VALGQNPPRRTRQGSAPKPTKPKSDTIKICQGVPVPDGYVIVAYMTSTACPHGAYLLRRQNDYESSLAVNGNARQIEDQTSTGTPSSSPNNSSRGSSPIAGKDSARDSKSTSPAGASAGGSSTQTALSVTR